MDPALKKSLWEGLSLVQDYLSDGVRRERELPAFSDGPLELSGGKGSARAFPARSVPGAASPAARPAGASSPESGAPAFSSGGGAPGLEPEGLLEALSGDSLKAIAAEIAECRKCRLCEKRTHTVPGTGSERPVVLVVGEGPGAEEDSQGLPFVGPAGQLLDKMLSSIGLSREENVYIANVVKCRPPMNRDPAPDEQAACASFLLRQMALLRPQAILTVGRIPTQALLATREPVTRLRGRFFSFRGIPLLPTYHPSALLRDPTLKRPAWEDLKLLRSRLEGGGAGAAE